MAIKRIKIIILSILFTQSLSLPSGCIESCTTYQKVSSYRTHQESNNRNDNTDSNISNISHLKLEYDRPGNWTEQNEYRTDNGHGKVYEEQGQYVEGPKRIRYFKKNYTSSYSNTHASNPDLLQSERLINSNRYNSLDNADSQKIYEESRNSESYRQEHNYNKLNNDQLQQSYRERESHIGRLENFGELSDTLQMSQRGTSAGNSELLHKITSNVNNLHDTIQKVNQEFQNLERKMHQSSRLNHVTSSNTLHMDTMNSVKDNVETTSRNHDQQVVESADYRQRYQNEHMPVNGNIYQNQLSNRQTYTAEDASYRNQNNVYNRNRPNIQHQRQEAYISQSHTNILPSNIQIPISENTNYQRYRENEQIGLPRSNNENIQREHLDTHKLQIIQNYRSSDDLKHTTLHENIDYTPYKREQIIQQPVLDVIGQRRELININPYENNQYYSHQRSTTYNRDDNYNPGDAANLQKLVTSTQGLDHGIQNCIHEMEHRYIRKNKRNVVDYNRNNNMQHKQNNERFFKNLEDYQQKQNNKRHKRNNQQLHNFSQHFEDLTQQTDDLTQQTSGNIEYGQLNQKPNNHNQRFEDLSQQTADLTQQTSGFDDSTQQTSGHIEFGQINQKPSSHNQRYEDLTQQTDDLTQQTSGNLEYGQLNQKPNNHNQRFEDLSQQTADLTQQTSGFDDSTQQTSGHIEFGQLNQKPSTHTQRYEDLTQQTDDLTQQTSGNLEYGQLNQKPNNHKQRFENLSQQTADFTQQTSGFDDSTQQTSGHIEFGQLNQKPSTHNQRHEDLTQQTDDLTQQTSGNLEYGQLNQKPNNHNQRFEDLSQQTADPTQQTSGFDDSTQQTSGHIEFGQLNQKPSTHTQRYEDLTQQTDDLTQQTSGNLEYGQLNQKPNNHNQRFEDLSQQTADLTQQTSGFDDSTQQTSGHIEFGQLNQKPSTHTQRYEDLTQQTDDLTQQTSGNLEYGQLNQKPNNHNQRFDDLSQQTADLTQQTSGFDDSTQQTSGHIEFGQINQKPSTHNQRFEDLTQQTDDLTQQTGGFDELSQQLSGLSENGQQKPQLYYPKYPFTHNEQFKNEEYLYPSISDTAKQFDINERKPLHVLTPAPKPKLKLRLSSTENPNNFNVHHSNEMTDQTFSYQNQLSDGSSHRQEVGINNDQKLNKNESQQEIYLNRKSFTKGGHRSKHIYRSSTQSQYPISTSVSRAQLNQELNLEEIYRKRENQNNNQENVPSQNSNSEGKIEPRILEAYGGGPYDVNHDDDIFNHVTQNPGATLPPHSDGIDPWYIREKPREVIPSSTTTTTPEITEKVETEVPPTFWTRLSHKFTTTFDKAKEKAKDLFG